MSPRILDGRDLAKAMGPGLRDRIAALPRPPGLAVIRVGDDPASKVYVASKKKRRALGFHSVSHELPADTSQDALMALVAALNADDAIDGILVQLPLPAHVHEQTVLDAVAPDKDVDGFHPMNTGLLSQGRPRSIACTPYGWPKLLEQAGVSLSGAHAVVIGRSNIVGRPMAMLLEQANATVSLCHSRTKNLDALLATADVVVAAVGRAEMVRGEALKPGCVVIDVGINRLDDGRLVGDVHFDSAAAVASAITPVPGGVGPMTITMLMHNTVDAAERRLGLR